LDLGISFAVREERTETGITVRAAPSSLWWGTIGSERTVTCTTADCSNGADRLASNSRLTVGADGNRVIASA